ncbi:MAG TPA: BTAD domain-containing putative transcriptional regulator [Pseudonocardiaceae bacterium]|nr:BTAD domain-containing putative transcriptional regulator [Pseudonocardiaceae bacterium]
MWTPRSGWPDARWRWTSSANRPWRLVIRAHAAAHRTQALRAYRSCRRLLVQELGIRPVPKFKTRAVLAEVVTGTRRSREQLDLRATDLGTAMDATLILFEHHRIGVTTDRLDEAVHVMLALLPPQAPTPTLPSATVIDPRHTLHSAGVRLNHEFDGTLRLEIVQRFLYSAHDRLRATSTVHNYLPLLAERSARQRLHAVAAADPDPDPATPTVVFLHTPGTAYGRMALGFFEHLAGNRAVAWCEGPEPADRTRPAAIAAMAERGIDITGQFRRPWTDQLIRTANVVVAFGHDTPGPGLPRQALPALEDQQNHRPPDRQHPVDTRRHRTQSRHPAPRPVFTDDRMIHG